MEAEGVRERENEGEMLTVGGEEVEAKAERVPASEGVREGVGLQEGVVLVEPLAVPLAQGVGLGVGLCEGVALGVPLTLGELLGGGHATRRTLSLNASATYRAPLNSTSASGLLKLAATPLPSTKPLPPPLPHVLPTPPAPAMVVKLYAAPPLALCRQMRWEGSSVKKVALEASM